jgi:hypothetical protein
MTFDPENAAVLLSYVAAVAVMICLFYRAPVADEG